MKIPARLIPLVEDGVIDEVMGQVKSGKEADVFVVRVGDEVRCAKVYKEANNRSFRQAVQYQEGRKVRNSRDARAIGKRSRYGQKEAESSWINAEVVALNTLSAAGLRVPTPFGFFDGVLIMELVVGEDGQPAPRLNDITLSPETAFLYHEEMIAQVVKMLCAGIIHGDLSEFNVLVDADGPVIIDLPQAVNAAGNNSAGMMFARDVDNMARYFGRFAPEILGLKYAKEIWALYEKGKLTPHVELTGQFQEPTRQADVHGVLGAIGDARMEHEEKRARQAGGGPGAGRFPGGRREEGESPGGASPGGNRPPWQRDDGRGRPGQPHQSHQGGSRDGGWGQPGRGPQGGTRDGGRGQPGRGPQTGPQQRDGGHRPGPRHGGRDPAGQGTQGGMGQGGMGRPGQSSQGGPREGDRGPSGGSQNAGPRDGGRGPSGRPPQAGPRDHGPRGPGKGPQAGPSGPRGGGQQSGNTPPGGGKSSQGGGNPTQGGANRNPPQAGDASNGDRWGRRNSPGGDRRGR